MVAWVVVGGLAKLAVEGGDAVDGVASDGGQVGHPDLLVALLADEREPGEPPPVARKGRPHLVEEATERLHEEYEQLLALKVSKASIAKIMGVSRSALVAFLERRGLAAAHPRG